MDEITSNVVQAMEGSNPPDEVIGGKLPPSSPINNKNLIITMLLTDALNGWKW